MYSFNGVVEELATLPFPPSITLFPISRSGFVQYYRPKSKSAPRWRRQTLKLCRWVLPSSACIDGDALNQQVCYNQQQQPAQYTTEVTTYVASMSSSSRLAAAARKLPPEQRHATDAAIEWWPCLVPFS